MKDRKTTEQKDLQATDDIEQFDDRAGSSKADSGGTNRPSSLPNQPRAPAGTQSEKY